MKKKITYREPPDSCTSATCEICGCDITEGDECWYVGDGIYICDNDKCIKEWEGNDNQEKEEK